MEATILENQCRTDAAVLAIQSGLRDVNQRVDRLSYAILAVGGAIVVATIVNGLLRG